MKIVFRGSEVHGRTLEAKMRFVNLTEHTINIHFEGGSVEVAPSGMVARAVPAPQVEGTLLVDGFQIRTKSKTSFVEVTGFPAEPEEGCLYLVSAAVGGVAGEFLGQQWKGLVWGPDTGKDAIRVNGQIAGVRGIQAFV